MSVLAIAERIRERVAKEIALADDPDQGLPIVIENRQMANPPQLHDVVGKGELVVAFERRGVRRHQIANFQIFHFTFSEIRSGRPILARYR